MMRFMVALNARYDGKVIVPETPLNLPPNQRVRLHVEPIPTVRVSFGEWIGLAIRTPTNPTPRFTNDDSLWE
jgi:hypothetical protein